MQFIQKFMRQFKAQKPVEAFVWLRQLKEMDDVAAISLCYEELHTEVQKDTFKDARYLTPFMALDEKTHIIVERITQHYVNIDHINTELEERIENAVFLYHRQMFLIYLSLIEHVTPLKHALLPIALSRAMFSATEMIKWRYYSYQTAPANVWLQLATLYQIAVAHNLNNLAIQRYEDHQAVTLTNSYISACMLGSLESLSLKSQQVELVNTMLTAWVEKTKIDRVYDEKIHLFYIDTAVNKPAKRIRNFNPSDTYLYWSLDDCNINIELCLSLIEFNIFPKQQTVKEIIKHPYALSTLEVLRAEWSRIDYKRQRRSEERIKTIKSATAEYGFEDVCYKAKQYSHVHLQLEKNYTLSETSLDDRLSSRLLDKTEHDTQIIYMDFGDNLCNIVDESQKGLGLRINKRANEVSLGMIISVTAQDQNSETKTGIIRSIRPIAGGEVHLGVEVLSSHAARLEVKNMHSDVVHASGSNVTRNLSNNAHFSGLFLPKENGISIQDTLIFPKIFYNKSDLYKLNTKSDEKIIKTVEIVEQREDWVRFTYLFEN